MKKYIIGNWKMNGSQELLDEFGEIPGGILCVPFPFLRAGLGAQDCSAHESGAFTGEVSAKMLAEIGVKYCIVGHSERRKYHSETNEIVKEKAARCQENGIIPIVCAEDLPQASGSIPASGDFMIAWEPASAIGTGKLPSIDEIKTMYNQIRQIAADKAILYGGSVKPDNAREILAVCDGVLVGGASLKKNEFMEIINE